MRLDNRQEQRYMYKTFHRVSSSFTLVFGVLNTGPEGPP